MMKNVPKLIMGPNKSINLTSALHSFATGITEEQAWALCFQCVKSAQLVLNSPTERDKASLATSTNHISICQDGSINPQTFLDLVPDTVSNELVLTKTRSVNEGKIISKLVQVIYEALVYGMDEDAERVLSPKLESFLEKMIYADESKRNSEGNAEAKVPEQDDQGGHKTFNFNAVLKACQDRLKTSSGSVSKSGSSRSVSDDISLIDSADFHYKTVLRDLVAETLELSAFLEKVAQGAEQMRFGFSSPTDSKYTGSHCQPENGIISPSLLNNSKAGSRNLDEFHFILWARLWVQVVGDLGNGVKLKKVDSSHSRPTNCELTPYEALMEDIRTQRYKLRQVLVDGQLPPRPKRDGYELILEYIRGRPQLKNAADRVLRPSPIRKLPPIEALMESIRKQEHTLRRTEKVWRR